MYLNYSKPLQTIVRVAKSSDTLLCQNWWLATLLLLFSKTVTRYAIVTGNDNALPVTRTPLSFLYKTDSNTNQIQSKTK